MALLTYALAAWWAWETLSGVLPFRFPPALQPFVVVLLAFGISHLPAALALAGAAAGGVALLHLVLVNFGTAPEPLNPRFSLPRWTRKNPGSFSRVPPLP